MVRLEQAGRDAAESLAVVVLGTALDVADLEAGDGVERVRLGGRLGGGIRLRVAGVHPLAHRVEQLGLEPAEAGVAEALRETHDRGLRRAGALRELRHGEERRLVQVIDEVFRDELLLARELVEVVQNDPLEVVFVFYALHGASTTSASLGGAPSTVGETRVSLNARHIRRHPREPNRKRLLTRGLRLWHRYERIISSSRDREEFFS